MRQGLRFRWCYFILVLGTLLRPASSVHAQLQLEYLSSTTGGPTSAVIYHDDFIISASGASLCVFDARPGKSIPYKRVYDKPLGARINDMAKRGSTLFLALNDGTISRWDLHNPMVPLPNGIYKPNHFSGAANDITLSHDSLYIAYTDRIVLLQEKHNIGAQFELIEEFALQNSQGGHITGGDLKGNWYAFVTAWQGRYARSALHLYDIHTRERVHFYPRSFSNARDVVWDADYPMLHVLGGTTLRGDSGLYYAVMVGERGGLREIFADTIPNGNATGIYQKQDTLYLATGKGTPANCTKGAIHVYQIRDSVQINRLGKIQIEESYGFAVGANQLFAASGNSGLIGLNQFAPEPNSCGSRSPSSLTPNGGGNTSADVFGERLVTAAPGHGLSIFNISNPRNPVPTRNAPFAPNAHLVQFSDDGKYLYLVEEVDNQCRVVIRDAQTFDVIGKVSGKWGHKEAAFWRGRVYLLRDSRDGIDIIDIRKPKAPVKERSILMPINDLYLDPNGRMFVTSRHNLRVFDLKGSEVKERVSLSKWDSGFGEVVAWEDEVFVYVNKKGLVKYSLEKEKNGKWQFNELFTIKPPHSKPEQLISNTDYIFIGYSEHGIFALDHAKLHRKGQWPTDAKFLALPETGLQSLFLKENFLYVVQFFAQTSIINLKED